MRGNMINAVNVCRPSPFPFPGIERACKQELSFGMPARGFQKKVIESLLAIRSIRSHVAQVAEIFLSGFSAEVLARIHTAIEWSCDAGAIILFQFLQGSAARK